jgi:UDP-apiose/xylose synthase
MEQVKKIVLVGCGGFIGSHLLRSLLSDSSKTGSEFSEFQKFQIIGIDTDAHRIEDLVAHPRFEYIAGDYQSVNLEEIVDSAYAVFSLASICTPALYNTTPLTVIQSNYHAPLALVEACARQKSWLIHFSTSEVYGRMLSSWGAHSENDILNEEKSPWIMGGAHAQRWSYANAKQLLERVIYAWGKESSLPWTIIRPFNFMGPYMDFISGVDGSGQARVFASFMKALLFHEDLAIVEGGKQKRAFTDIKDVLEFLARLLANKSKVQNKIYNVGNPHNEISIKDLAHKMISLYQKEKSWQGDIQYLSGLDFYGEGYEDSERRMPDISEAEKDLQWKPSVSLDESLRTTMQWYQDHYSGQN